MAPPPELELQAQLLHRTTEVEDEALGDRLVTTVRSSLERGGAPAAAVAIRPAVFELFPLNAIAQNGRIPPFLAGLSTSPTPMGPAEAVGVIGTFRWRRGQGDAGVPIALVFLEWTDCRWWFWRALLQPSDEGWALREDTETRARAMEGDSKPLGLGGWWSLGRRSNIRLALTPRTPTWVH